MSSRIFSMPDALDWKQAYMAAILEKDRSRVPYLVGKATEYLSARTRELEMSGLVPCEEIEAIHDALYLLHALHTSLAYRDDAGEWDDVA